VIECDQSTSFWRRAITHGTTFLAWHVSPTEPYFDFQPSSKCRECLR
jgi:hypothetical protein